MPKEGNPFDSPSGDDDLSLREAIKDNERETSVEVEEIKREGQTPTNAVQEADRILARPSQASAAPTPGAVTSTVCAQRPANAGRRRYDLYPDPALQAYLIRQQRLAGIPSDQIVMINGQRLGQGQPQAGSTSVNNRPRAPQIVQITNDGIVVPRIPPAQFRGIVPPLPAALAQLSLAAHVAGVEATNQPSNGPPNLGQGPANTWDRNIEMSLQELPRPQIQNQNAVAAVKGEEDPDVQITEPPHTAVGRATPVQIRRLVQPDTQEVSDRENAPRPSQPSGKLPPAVRLSHGALNTQIRANPLSATFVLNRKRPRLANNRVQQQVEGPVAPRFNIFNAIIKHPELALTLAKHLRVKELIDLYAISRDFHNIVNTRFTTVILSQATQKAPDSARIFPFRCYQKLCVADPARNPHPNTAHAQAEENRTVPSFRWLIMILYRERIVREIMALLHQEGVGVPPNCALAIKKLWFLMDIPDNNRRIGTIQNKGLWSDEDLFFATLLFVKLDMRFTDPVTGSGRDGMRRLALAQPSFTLLWRILRRTALQTHFETLRAYVRWRYRPLPHEANCHIFGVAPRDVGALQYEGYGKTRSRVRLQRPDELVLKESLRRQLNMQEKYVDMFLWGYVNPNTIKVDDLGGEGHEDEGVPDKLELEGQVAQE